MRRKVISKKPAKSAPKLNSKRKPAKAKQRPTPVAEQPKPETRRRRAPQTSTRVYVAASVDIESTAQLRTIEATDDLWARAEKVEILHIDQAFKGSIVRLQPPAASSDEAVAAIQRALMNDGALAVKVAPRENRPKVLVKGKPVARLTHRQLVASMVASANSRNVESLAALCTEVMDEEKL